MTDQQDKDALAIEAAVRGQERIKGVAKVLDKHYVSWKLPEVAASGRDAPAGDDEGDEGAQELAGAKRKGGKTSKAAKKRQKRLDRLKERGFTDRQAWENLCNWAAQGQPCKRLVDGRGCKFSHDAAEYFKHKPPMLTGLRCLQFEESGYCSAGIQCRVGDAHIRLQPVHVSESAGDAPGDASATAASADKEVDSADQANAGAAPIPSNVDNRSEAARASSPASWEFDRIGESNYLRLEQRKKLRGKVYFESAPDRELRQLPKPDFAGKIYVAPLTTVGNLPFRRIVKGLGADITCGEMALAKNLVQGDASEWSLVRRHKSEDLFGVQLAGGDPATMARAVQLLERECSVDFVDINLGCPIDLICDQGAGSALLQRPNRIEAIVREITDKTQGRMPIGLKVRMGWSNKKPTTHSLACAVQSWKHGFKYGGAISYLSIHGRSRTQRYTNTADYDYIHKCSSRVVAAERFFRDTHPDAVRLAPIPVFGNGDVLSYLEWDEHLSRVEEWRTRLGEVEEETEIENSRMAAFLGKGAPESLDKSSLRGESDLCDDLDAVQARLSTCMVGRGALIKPWLCTEIKERRHWDISGSERFDILRDFCNFGLEHWGADAVGVEKTRRFLLEWMSFTCRYVPVGIMDPLYVPQHINDRPPHFVGRDDRETILGSTSVKDWVQVAEMLLGPAPPDFQFQPKHKSNSYAARADDLLRSAGKLPTAN